MFYDEMRNMSLQLPGTRLNNPKICMRSSLKTFQKVQGLSQDLEIRCLKLAIVKFLGVQIFRGYHNLPIFQP